MSPIDTLMDTRGLPLQDQREKLEKNHIDRNKINEYFKNNAMPNQINRLSPCASPCSRCTGPVLQCRCQCGMPCGPQPSPEDPNKNRKPVIIKA